MGKLPFELIERKVIIKKEYSTNEKYGCNPFGRDVKTLIEYGIINLNKPKGPTSHQVSDYVQKIFNIKKAGHSGTLDPGVTGVLPVALEKATRIVQTLLGTGKEYVCLMHVHKLIDENEIRKGCDSFIGKIKQIPPIKSAVKRQEREREIYYLEILEIDGQDVLFRVGCEAGTYIRKLVWQIGQKLKTGAHMQQLIRTKVGAFTDKDWVSLQDVKDAYEFYKDCSEKEIRNVIKPYEIAVNHLPKIWVSDNTVDALCHGANLYIIGISKLHNKINENDDVAIFTLKDELICLGKAAMSSEEMLKKEKGIAVVTNKVFMERGVYPRYAKDN
ncbi:MAG: RNA-guided pseudouridylation complex pseudouridine synthase subunit Cbf5 [Candidatus Woesearchaeota archaeon]|nr:RNA-guided pseudouridylation complex pseudouridine synthase subunit Cbf5 [Candidatus Woesearchaeota archaeon]